MATPKAKARWAKCGGETQEALPPEEPGNCREERQGGALLILSSLLPQEKEWGCKAAAAGEPGSDVTTPLPRPLGKCATPLHVCTRRPWMLSHPSPGTPRGTFPGISRSGNHRLGTEGACSGARVEFCLCPGGRLQPLPLHGWQVSSFRVAAGGLPVEPPAPCQVWTDSQPGKLAGGTLPPGAGQQAPQRREAAVPFPASFYSKYFRHPPVLLSLLAVNYILK